MSSRRRFESRLDSRTNEAQTFLYSRRRSWRWFRGYRGMHREDSERLDRRNHWSVNITKGDFAIPPSQHHLPNIAFLILLSAKSKRNRIDFWTVENSWRDSVSSPRRSIEDICIRGLWKQVQFRSLFSLKSSSWPPLLDFRCLLCLSYCQAIHAKKKSFCCVHVLIIQN